jgi:hypothetical protein
MDEKSSRSAVQLRSADRDPDLRMRPVRSTRANSANTPPKTDRWSGPSRRATISSTPPLRSLATKTKVCSGDASCTSASARGAAAGGSAFGPAEVSVAMRNDSTSDFSFCRLSRRLTSLGCRRLSSGSCPASSECSQRQETAKHEGCGNVTWRCSEVTASSCRPQADPADGPPILHQERRVRAPARGSPCSAAPTRDHVWTGRPGDVWSAIATCSAGRDRPPRRILDGRSSYGVEQNGGWRHRRRPSRREDQTR